MTSDEKLKALSKAYQKELPKKISEIESLFELGIQGNLDFASFATMYRLVHNLIGSGATFGLLSVSTTARTLEVAMNSFFLAKKTPTPNEVEEFRPFLRALSSECFIPLYNSSEFNAPSFKLAPRILKNSKLIYLFGDNTNAYNELQLQLENFGYEVVSFLDSENFIYAVKEKVPDAVIIDGMFQDREARRESLLLQLREEVSDPFFIFFISDKNDLDTRLKAIRAGSDGFIAKPINMTSLIEKLDRIMQKVEKDPIRVVVLDDEINVAEFHASLLHKDGIETYCTNDPKTLLETIAAYQPDLLLSDLYMPYCSGLELAKVIRQMDEYLALPIMFLSVESDEQIQGEAIGAGAEDFITKPVDPQQLINKIRVKAERFKQMREKIQQDSLTSLYNHTILREFLTKAIESAERYGNDLSFAMIDIDHFKSVNDTYGHQAGDGVLKALSLLLLERVRGADTVGRYGGEEFGIILPHAKKEDAYKLLDRIRVTFSEILHISEDTEFRTTFSCGICQWHKGMSVTELVERSDEAMYQAKQQGRNQIIIK